MSKHEEAIWNLLREYIANEDATEPYSEQMAETLCEHILPNVWNEVAQLEAELKEAKRIIADLPDHSDMDAAVLEINMLNAELRRLRGEVDYLFENRARCDG